MAGFGRMAFGKSPYGLMTPAEGEAPPTGQWGSRYLDPATKDYQIDPASKQQKQMPAVRQRVLIAVTTVLRSSAANPNLGVKLPTKMGTTYEAEVSNAVLVALTQMIDVEKILRVDGISVKRGSTRSEITISFTDLTTMKPDELTVR